MRFFYFVELMALVTLGFGGCNRTAENKQPTILEGNWAVVGMSDGGEVAPPEEIKGMAWSINGSEIIATDPDGSSGKMSFKLDTNKTPPAIDVTVLSGNCKGENVPGICSLEGERLRVCLGESKGDRPTEFGSRPHLIEFEKITR